MPLALNDNYVVQKKEPASVLKDWKVRYTAPAEMDVNSVEWTIDGEKSNDNPWGRVEKKLGTFSVKLTGTIGGNNQSFERTISVSEVYSSDFKLLTYGDDELLGQYIKDKDYPHWVLSPSFQIPKRAGMFMTGTVAKANIAGNPEPVNFKWGYVQSIEGSFGAIWQFHKSKPANAFNPKSHPLYYKTPAMPAGTHDSFVEGNQFYDKAVNIGNSYKEDTPRLNAAVLFKSFHDAKIEYRIKSPNITSLRFTVWQMVVQTETKQYVPFKQQDWKLEWNTSFAGPWVVEIIGDPAGPTTKAPDVTAVGGGYVHAEKFKKFIPVLQQ